MTKLYFIRRTPSEVSIFGGSVYVDIDGKRVGEVGMTDLVIDAYPGQHIIKMYKSHTFDSFIGFADVTLNIEEGKDLTLRYSAPMTTTQPGHIVVADFVSIDEINNQINQSESALSQEMHQNNVRLQMQNDNYRRKTTSTVVWIIVLSVLTGIIFYLYQMALFDLI